MQMTCPKCHGQMRQYERSGVTVDQCTECRGIFLDRGELEKIFEAESAWNRGQRQPAPPPAGQYAPPPPAQGYPAQAPAPGYGQHRGYHGHYHGHYRSRRRRSFLGELFD
jgi:Zn-finger nucleic acid-binding protein